MEKMLIFLMVVGLASSPVLGNRPKSTIQAEIPIIPKPEKISLQSGSFTPKGKPVVLILGKDNCLDDLALNVVQAWMETRGERLEIKNSSENIQPSSSIVLNLDNTLKYLGTEGYKMKITSKKIEIQANQPAGLFYGIQSLRQLLWNNKQIPCLEIEDRPRFAWRGLLLDCGRHFMPIDLIKKTLDLLAYYKMNIFHWHLTEDQGWRLEIKRYPLLTEVGAWRFLNGQRYGGYYTQEQVKEIIAYARSRYITVIPEIEMPGHCVAALAAYPELSCTGSPISVEEHWGIFNDVLCPGKETTYEFIQNVLDEVCELFPSTYIHIGGDECPKHYWKTCPDCQKRIKEENLKDENELQGYFTRRIQKYLETKQKRIIGWDEILEGGVTQTAVVQSWRGPAGAVQGTKQGNQVISSPWHGTYLYCPQVQEEVHSNYSTLNSLEKAYAFDPVPEEMTKDQAALVLGGECCLWSEYTFPFEVEPQLFPRLCAIAESVWSLPNQKDYANFSIRLKSHLITLEKMQVDYHRPEIKIGEWEKGEISRLWTQLWWDITPFVKKEGIYRINFVQNEGKDEIIIQSVSLFENEKEICRFSEINRSQTDSFSKYPLQLKSLKSGAKYTIRASVVSWKDKAESAGSVWLRYFKPDGSDLW